MIFKKKKKTKSHSWALYCQDTHTHTQRPMQTHTLSWTICPAPCRLVKTGPYPPTCCLNAEHHVQDKCVVFFSPLSKWRHLSFPTSFSSISSCCSHHFLFIFFHSFSSGSPHPPSSSSHCCPISPRPLPFLFTFSLPAAPPHYLTLSLILSLSH